MLGSGLTVQAFGVDDSTMNSARGLPFSLRADDEELGRRAAAWTQRPSPRRGGNRTGCAPPVVFKPGSGRTSAAVSAMPRKACGTFSPAKLFQVGWPADRRWAPMRKKNAEGHPSGRQKSAVASPMCRRNASALGHQARWSRWSGCSAMPSKNPREC